MNTRVKFDWTINLGHVAIIFSAIVSVLIAYTNIIRTQDGQEFRIESLEQSRVENTRTNREVLQALGGIKEEIAALKVQVQRQR